MKLFYSSGACSLSPHIVALEAGLPITLEKVDMKTSTWSGGDFKKINPKGYVPTLQLDNGEVLTEGAAIVQYLADQKPAAKLAPAFGTFERYRLMETLNFIATEIHKTFSPLFADSTPAEFKGAMKDKLGMRLGTMSDQLKNKPYLMGEHFTVADAYLFTVLNWCGHVKFDLTPFPTLTKYMERVAARPAVQAALKAEGLLK